MTQRVHQPHFIAVPAGTKPAECRSCHATIYWIRTPAGKAMPIDCDVEGGYPPDVHWDSGGPDPLDQNGQGVSHFATCPYANQHRRPR